MSHTFKGLVCAVLTSFASPSTADEAKLVAAPMVETLRPAAETGGARMVGLQVPGGSVSADLSALIPEDWQAGTRFCVRMGTSDGLYDSENTYTAPDDLSDRVDVPHVALSSHASALVRQHPDGLGIRILKGDCADVTDDTPHALALWRDARPGGAVAVFVNSFDADRLVAFPDGGDAVECQPIAADISVAFDRRCEVPLPDGASTFTVELQPIKDKRLGRAETIVIELQ